MLGKKDEWGCQKHEVETGTISSQMVREAPLPPKKHSRLKHSRLKKD